MSSLKGMRVVGEGRVAEGRREVPLAVMGTLEQVGDGRRGDGGRGEREVLLSSHEHIGKSLYSHVQPFHTTALYRRCLYRAPGAARVPQAAGRRQADLQGPAGEGAATGVCSSHLDFWRDEVQRQLCVPLTLTFRVG